MNSLRARNARTRIVERWQARLINLAWRLCRDQTLAEDMGDIQMGFDVDELDRILASEEILTPSSGFAARVMEAVQDAAAKPPPLLFPWGRPVAGVMASGRAAL